MIQIRMNELNSIEKMTIDNVNECQLIDNLIDAIKCTCDDRDKIKCPLCKSIEYNDVVIHHESSSGMENEFNVYERNRDDENQYVRVCIDCGIVYIPR